MWVFVIELHTWDYPHWIYTMLMLSFIIIISNPHLLFFFSIAEMSSVICSSLEANNLKSLVKSRLKINLFISSSGSQPSTSALIIYSSFYTLAILIDIDFLFFLMTDSKCLIAAFEGEFCRLLTYVMHVEIWFNDVCGYAGNVSWIHYKENPLIVWSKNHECYRYPYLYRYRYR